MLTDSVLHGLFAELRRLKQEEMPKRMADPVEQAYHDERIGSAIRRVEEKIEREMNHEREEQMPGVREFRQLPRQ